MNVSTKLNDDGVYRYFDKKGNEFFAGDTVIFPDGKERKLYLTTDGKLGVDATNPTWIKNGRAVACECGIYPIDEEDLKNIELKIKTAEMCYTLIAVDGSIGVVKWGETGYYKTDWGAGFTQKYVDSLNEKLGVSEDDAFCMITTSMADLKDGVMAWEKHFRICKKILADKKARAKKLVRE